MLSFNFWVNLIFAFVVFAFALGFINRSKIKAIRYFLAARLRRKLIPKLKAILPILGSSFHAQDENLYSVFRLRADLELLCTKTDVLFDVERLALVDFLTEFSSVTAQFKAGLGTEDKVNNLILSGQRALNELNEFER